MQIQLVYFHRSELSNNKYWIARSIKKDTKVVSTMEAKKFILKQLERKMIIAKIGNAVFKEFGIKTSKSAIRVFAKKIKSGRRWKIASRTGNSAKVDPLFDPTSR